jgi:hypothetical protein
MRNAESRSPSRTAALASASLRNTVTSAMPRSSRAARIPLVKLLDSWLPSRSTTPYSNAFGVEAGPKSTLKIADRARGTMTASMTAERSRRRWRRSFAAMSRETRMSVSQRLAREGQEDGLQIWLLDRYGADRAARRGHGLDHDR